jgi:NAD(P)-dependent dehydrogenase (short-subunit alcohol dehydrogenase family)
MSNAGILTHGPLEVLPVAAVRHEFEVNVFAGLAVINALPALRRARGRIGQIGEMTERLPPPFNGPSSVSKRPWRLSPTSTGRTQGLGAFELPQRLMLSCVSAAGRR